MTTAGPSPSCSLATWATRSSWLKSSTTSGLPVAMTRPDAEPWTGSARPRAAAAPVPLACSTWSIWPSPTGSASTTRSAPDSSRAC